MARGKHYHFFSIYPFYERLKVMNIKRLPSEWTFSFQNAVFICKRYSAFNFFFLFFFLPSLLDLVLDVQYNHSIRRSVSPLIGRFIDRYFYLFRLEHHGKYVWNNCTNPFAFDFLSAINPDLYDMSCATFCNKLNQP